MTTKSEILLKIGFEELIGTQFEELMTIKILKKGTTINYKKLEKFSTYFIVEGQTRHTVHTPEGDKFYRDFFKGDIPGLSFTLPIRKESKCFRLFDIDVVIKKNSIIGYLPFEKILDIEFKNKNKILEKLIMIGIEDHFKEFNHLLLKAIYSDKEFFIKYLEKHKVLNIGSTRIISECLNINLRTLQRILKDLLEKRIIERLGTKIFINDQFKLNEYKEQFKK